jgi:hypothetical protein
LVTTSDRVDNAEIALGYAPEAIVPGVPSTPMTPPFASSTATRAEGSITPRTGKSSSTRVSSRATELTVPHATTIAFTPRFTSTFEQLRAYRMTVSRDRVPYGTRAVSPR